MMHLEFKNTDNGFCRIYYNAFLPANLPSKKRKALFCFQLSIGKSFALYRCSLDGEPSHEIDLNEVSSIEFPNESPLEKDFLNWARSQSLNFQPSAGELNE